MKLDRYDEYPKKLKAPRGPMAQRVMLLILAAGFAAAGIVNLCVGGKPWCLYVLGGEIVFWMAFFDNRLIEHGLTDRILSVAGSISLYLLLIDWLSGWSGWSVRIAVPNLYLGAMIASSLLFLIRLRFRRQNFLALYTSVIASLILLAVSVSGLAEYGWPLIALAAYSLAVIAATLAFFRKPFMNEVIKRWMI